MTRGQTTIDFAIGSSLFLVAAVFVVAFVPSMFAPHVGNQGSALIADRTADRLAEDVLASPGDPYVLDESCTAEFFDGDGDACRADVDDDDLNAAVGVAGHVGLNVTVASEAGGVVYAAGDSYANANGRVAVADRSVLLGGQPHELHVRAWS